MRSYHQQLQSHALNDLTTRAKSGIIIYAAVWFIIAFSYQLNLSHPSFFYINTAIVTLLFISRVSHLLLFKRNTFSNVSLMNQWLVLSVLISAAHWGGMTAWIIYDETLIDLRTIMLIITPAFALAGAITLSISSDIRTLYPALMLLPCISVLAFQSGTESLMLAVLSSIAMIYAYSSTKATHNDYWAAITNHLVAEERAELMEKLSTTDQLTQLKNRMFFDTEFTREWKRCSRLKCPLSLIMIDLDYFKKINDQYGHVFGDECLRKVASTIASQVSRPNDCVARYGGEEFVILLPDTDAKAAEMLAKRMIKSVSELELHNGNENIRITCSIGGSTVIPDYKIDQKTLIKLADSALYYAKSAGRNRYYSEDSP